MTQAFHPSNPDFTLSPYTGLTRESWIEAGRHLLAGVFRNIEHFEAPIILPRAETEITYPHEDSPGDIYEAECKAEMFEGLTRTLLIAAPLLKEDPDLTICGYRLADYYRSHILRSCTPGDPVCVGTYETLQEMTGHADPFRPFQQTVETCALVIGLWVSSDVIWNTYTSEERDRIASFISSFAHANTVPQNWRFFNLLDLAFLHMNGYPIDREIMMDHASELLAYYAGDGWYRDGHTFDYYSCWAFQVYAPLWNLWYGYDEAPEMARLLEIVRRSEGRAKAIILKGTDSLGHPRQLAMTVYDGWDELRIRKSTGTNPESKHSLVVYAITKRNKQYGGAEPYVLISQTITKESGEDFTDEELFPISEVIYSDPLKVGGFGKVIIRFKNGEEKAVDYAGIEGTLLL